MTPTERRTSQIARLRAIAAERYTGPELDHILAEIAFVERVWSGLDHEPSTGKGSSADERRAAGKLLFVRTDLRVRDRPYETDEAAADRQARRQAAVDRLQAERLARPPSLPAVRVPEVVKPRAPAAQMSLFGEVT